MGDEKLKELVEKLKYDPLTKFYSRVYFDVYLKPKIERRLEREGGCVVLYDLNCLKEVNQKYGYEAGDDYIRRVVKEVSKEYPSKWKVRLGGDEFLHILFERRGEEVYSTHKYTLAIQPYKESLSKTIAKASKKLLREKGLYITFKDVVEILMRFDFMKVEKEDFDNREMLYGITILPLEKDDGEILVRRDVSESEKRLTIIHELLHAYSYIKNLKWDEDRVERESVLLYRKLYGVEKC